MSEQRTPYQSDKGEQLSPKTAETTLKEIKALIAQAESEKRPASHILELINEKLKESQAQRLA